MENKRKLGGAYEGLAADYLISEGYEILERNYRCKIGEVDLIASKVIRGVRWLVFVEVKYRATLTHGSPGEAVTPAKQKTIRRTAQYYLMTNRYPAESACRFDVILFLGSQMTHLEGVF